jgi:hypothetical protein
MKPLVTSAQCSLQRESWIARLHPPHPRARTLFRILAWRQHTNQYVWQQSQRQEGFNNALDNMKIHRISGSLAHVYEKLEKQSC